MNDDDNFYDIDGTKLCDGFGNSMIVNDGHKMYDLETGKTIHEEEYEKNKIIENPYITICAKILYYFIAIIMKCCELLFYKNKNREI